MAVGAMLLEGVQHQPVNYSWPDHMPRGDSVHCEQTVQNLQFMEQEGHG